MEDIGESIRTTPSFARYISMTSAEETVTISMVVPVLMELKYHLDEVRKLVVTWCCIVPKSY